ncbi:MAG: hypothetical protein ACLTL7_20660 [Enterocloster bolteae]|uniref:hypothetical protein n=1 Tax=Lachnospiraceae TaxID=186803 RepID=UPI0039930A69
MSEIERLVNQFRDAIDMARDSGDFDKDISFYKFPRGCCGDASDLLAQFLLENGIRTYYVCRLLYYIKYNGISKTLNLQRQISF